MVISVSMSYHFKKNVLLFSVIQSLSIAVVYYVGDMVFSIAAHQGAISPYAAVVLPLAITIILSWIISELGKKV
jgi:lipopolysaccharide export system permease protein